MYNILNHQTASLNGGPLSHTIGRSRTLLLMCAFCLCVFCASKPTIQVPMQATYSSDCLLPAPADLTAHRTGGTIDLMWSPVTGATAYSVTVYELGTLELVSREVAQGTGISIGGLDSGKAYRVVVAAMCSSSSISEFVVVEDILT